MTNTSKMTKTAYLETAILKGLNELFSGKSRKLTLWLASFLPAFCQSNLKMHIFYLFFTLRIIALMQVEAGNNPSSSSLTRICRGN